MVRTTTSIAEQQRIVEILDETFKEIALAEANNKNNLANALEFFDSYLNRVFRGKGDQRKLKALAELKQSILQKAFTRRVT